MVPIQRPPWRSRNSLRARSGSVRPVGKASILSPASSFSPPAVAINRCPSSALMKSWTSLPGSGLGKRLGGSGFQFHSPDAAPAQRLPCS